MNLDAHCPKCDANLHIANFSVLLKDAEDAEFAWLHIDCWACTWNTEFKVERFEYEEAE